MCLPSGLQSGRRHAGAVALLTLACCFAPCVRPARPVSLGSHKLRTYQLVHPQSLVHDTGLPEDAAHHTRIPGSRLQHRPRVRIGLQAFGRKFDVVLHRSDGIVGRDFAHVSTSSVNGSTILRKSDIDHCFYHGVLVGEPSSSITGYTCGDGLEGSIRTELGEHYIVMPSSRVHELQVAASTLRHARSEGQLPQHVVFRTSDHMLWREDDRACERGAAWRQADSPPPNRSADAPGGALAGHSDRAPSAAALAPMQGCTCLAAWGHLGRWYPGGGCQDPAGDGGSWCFTEDECGFGGGSS